jgi:hypothetical protein
LGRILREHRPRYLDPHRRNFVRQPKAWHADLQPADGVMALAPRPSADLSVAQQGFARSTGCSRNGHVKPVERSAFSAIDRPGDMEFACNKGAAVRPRLRVGCFDQRRRYLLALAVLLPLN